MTGIEKIIIALIVAILGGAASVGFAEYQAEQACLRAGWPEVRWRPFAPTYCVKRVEQTDVVARLDSLQGARR